MILDDRYCCMTTSSNWILRPTSKLVTTAVRFSISSFFTLRQAHVFLHDTKLPYPLAMTDGTLASMDFLVILSKQTGIKVWALCDIKGYCLISSVDGGIQGDPKLRRWFNCPLGRTTRQVLWVVLGASPLLSAKLDGSGVHVAMDNFFTSPTLFECLASHNIFAVGTCRSDRTAGAASYLESLGRTLHERGDMNFSRSGEMAFVHWRDSKDITFCSTIHIAQPSEEELAIQASEEEGAPVSVTDHFTPLPYE